MNDKHPILKGFIAILTSLMISTTGLFLSSSKSYEKFGLGLYTVGIFMAILVLFTIFIGDDG